MLDIDECAEAKEVNGCDQICGNTPGSFVCSCNPGFELNINRKSCDGKAIITTNRCTINSFAKTLSHKRNKHHGN